MRVSCDFDRRISDTNEGRTRCTPSNVDARLAITAASREIRSALGSYRRSTSLLSRSASISCGPRSLPSSIQYLIVPSFSLPHHRKFGILKNSKENVKKEKYKIRRNRVFSLSFSSHPDDPPNRVSLANASHAFAFHRGESTTTGILFVYKKIARRCDGVRQSLYFIVKEDP